MYTPQRKRLFSATLLSSAILLGACDDPAAPQAAAGLGTEVPEVAESAPPVTQQTVLAGNEQGELRNEREACSTCGTIRSISAVSVEGQASGAGTVIGAIVGGLAGSQVGGGSGRKIATVAGAVGGAVAGNTIEKNRNNEQWYEVLIAMEDGSQQVLSVPSVFGLAVGTTVTVEGNEIRQR